MSVTASFAENSRKTYTTTLFQYDRGQKLIFEGIEVKDGTEVHFSNSEMSTVAIACKAKDNAAYIPDGYFDSGLFIYAWVYARSVTKGSAGKLDFKFEDSDSNPGDDVENMVVTKIGASKTGTEEGTTLFEVVIPIQKRPAIIRQGSSTGEGAADTPEEMEYSVSDENLEIQSMGNDGTGMPDLRNYKVDGEQLIFTN